MSRSAFKILVARGRIFVRFLRRHAFVLFVLGPMIVGAVAWVGERYLDLLRRPLLDLFQISNDAAGVVWSPRAAVLVAWAWIGALWPSTRREIYGRGRDGQDLLDALPVREVDRFTVTATVVAARALGLGVVLGCLLWALDRSPAPEPAPFLSAMPRLAVAAVSLAWLTVALVSLSVRAKRSPVGSWPLLAGALSVLVVSSVEGLRLIVAPWLGPGEALLAAAGAALATGPAMDAAQAAQPAEIWGAQAWQLVALALGMLLAAGLASLSRRRDLETAQQADRAWRGGVDRLPRQWPIWRTSIAERAQLRRDLLMIRRRFSPVVSTAAVVVVTAWLAMPTLASDPELPELWRLRGLIVLGTVACLAAVSVVPFLLKAQLPVFWLEKSTGVALEHVWRTKLLLAGLSALPCALVGAVLLIVLGPGSALEVVYGVGQLVLCCAMVSALVGISVFEIAEEPVLGLLLSSFVAGGVSALMIFYPAAWWLWLVFFGYFASQLGARASRRVRYTEVEL